MTELDKLPSKAANLKPRFNTKRKILERRKDLDLIVHRTHSEVFARTDCLTCANCCKTTSPLFIGTDIERIANYLQLKPSQFVDRYLVVDEDGDDVLKSVPCPFLGSDNYCSIYAVRPKACRGYPHTDQPKQRKILSLTLKNASICPAVLEILETVLDEVS
ncbi:MAG: YkgJ family cysteine cluster protein [Saprospiraceae bacterium]|nr:YkgJ family cysteine cluster protein [Saprospiraceae bacterium]